MEQVKKILVIGSKGMAGHMMVDYLTEDPFFDVYHIARNIGDSEKSWDLDVSDTARLGTIIADQSFDYIINCIGILNRDAEEHPSKAIWFNSYFPHFLADFTRDSATRIIHISTDCVFSGARGAYTEDDVRDGVGYYARSKALGELENQKDLTLRTSIIGPELNKDGIGLFHWFMTRPVAEAVKGYTAAWWSGITTLELAKVVAFMIRDGKLSGLLQVAPRQRIDKFTLLNLFNDIFRQGQMSVTPDGAYKVDKSLKSIRTDFNYTVPDYTRMLLELKEWMAGSKRYSYV